MIHLGDCIAWMRTLGEGSVDSIACDPPYGLGFMGKAWDAGPPGIDWARGCLRVLKPGGHLVAFGGTRTVHRLTCAIEDAGFEIRDSIGWVYYSGFPKSLDVAKGLDKRDAVEERSERAVRFQRWLSEHITAQEVDRITGTEMGYHLTTHPTQPLVATPELFDLLRPSLPEPPTWVEELVADRIVISRDFESRAIVGSRSLPAGRAGFAGERFSEVAGQHEVAITAPFTPSAIQWSGWGTALKPAIEPSVLARKPLIGTVAANVLRHGTGALNIDGCRFAPGDEGWVGPCSAEQYAEKCASVVGCDSYRNKNAYGEWSGAREDSFSPAGRFPANLYACPKASRSERERGCDGLPTRSGADAVDRNADTAGLNSPRTGAGRTAESVRNFHPTVKPVRLMRWLCRLVTPPGGIVLDPFSGSGSCGVAAVLEGLQYMGAEIDPDYHRIAVARIEHAKRWPASWADTAPGPREKPRDEIEDLERNGQVVLFDPPAPEKRSACHQSEMPFNSLGETKGEETSGTDPMGRSESAATHG